MFWVAILGVLFIYSKATSLMKINRARSSDKEALSSSAQSYYEDFWQKYKVIFEIFDCSTTWSAGYILFIFGRKLLFAVLLVFFNNYAIVSLVGMILVNGGMVFSLFRIRPYKNRLLQWRDVICELCFGFIHFLSLFLFGRATNRDAIGYGMVTACWIILINQMICLLTNCITAIANRYKAK